MLRSALRALRQSASARRSHAVSRVAAPASGGRQAACQAALAGFGASAVVALSWPHLPLGCESAAAATDADVRVVTYNVLSPPLATASHFCHNDPAHVDHRNRFPKICEQLEREVGAGSVIGLQEVDIGWAGQLHTFFAQRGYTAVWAQYGKTFNGYMGVMLAWPTEKYDVQDVELCRLSDTAPKGMWPKRKSLGLNPYGIFTSQGMKDVLGIYPPSDPQEKELFEWNLARDRFNEVIFARLKPKKSGRPFVVSTYHMPCLFGSAEKVRVMNIHAYLLLSRLRAFAKDDPAILMGDFNVKPGTSPYKLLESGGSLAAASTAPEGPEETFGLKSRLPKDMPWPAGLHSAYCKFHGKEPAFTNYAKGGNNAFVGTLDYIWYTPGPLSVVDCPALPESTDSVGGPYPNAKEPSDHVLLGATLRLSGPAARL